MGRKRGRRANDPRGQRDPLAEIQESIQDVIDAHFPELAMRGVSYLARVGEFHWNPPQSMMVCPVGGSAGRTYQVTIERDENSPRFVDACCTCPYSDGWEFCKHTYAALTRLEQRLSDPRDAIRQRLFGIGSRESWEVALEELDQFLNVRQSTGETDRDRSRRIVWRIDYRRTSDGPQLDIRPYEQKLAKGKRKWTKGRKVRWERFAEEPELWISPVDEKIAAEVQRDGDASIFGYRFFSANYRPDMFRLLECLVDHPLVFWGDAPDKHIRVSLGSIGLSLQPARGGMKICPAIDGDVPPDDRDVMLVQRGARNGVIAVARKDDRITLARADAEVVELVARMSQLKPLIPNKNEDELLSRLASLESTLPVALPEKLLGAPVEPDRRLYLRLTPDEGGGLLAEMKVRPIAEGHAFEPGGGQAVLSAMQDGKRVVVHRELEQEKQRALRTADELELVEHLQMRGWRWQILADEDALDFISAAQDRSAVPDGDLVVEWPEDARLSVSQEIGPQAMKVEIEDRKDWFGLKGSIEVDGEQIPLSMLLAGIRSGQRYIAVGKNKWLRIAKAFRDRLAALADVVHEHRSGLEFDISAAPVLDEVVDDEHVLKACRRYKEVVRRLEAATEMTPDPPISLSAELRDYQLAGYRWLRRLAEWGVGGCLADDMGLGKTVQTLAVLIDRMEEGPALVVAPTSVGFNWVREAIRFAPSLKPHLYRETDRDGFLSGVGEGDVVVISYGLLQRDADKLADVAWGTLVLDEAQKIKNSQTKTARAVRQIGSKWRLALTGTPVENHLGELWSIFRAINAGLFGSWERFKERFAEPIERHKNVVRRHALAHVVRPFILRRTKAEVLDELPSRTEMLLTAELSPQERKRYEEARLGAVAKLAGAGESNSNSGGDKRFEVLAALTKLRQLACHPGLVDGSWNKSSAKLDLLLEVIAELREGNHRALIFSQFTQHLGLIRKALDERGTTYRYLDGTTGAKQRQAEVDAFQRGDGEVFLISLKAGGTGLNLTAADYVIHMDPWWNPAVEDQATDRAHRIGQSRPVTVYRLVANDTIEEQILALHADKRDLVAGVLEGTDQAAQLSTKELVELIRSGGKSAPALEAEGKPAAKKAGRSSNGKGPSTRGRGRKKRKAVAGKRGSQR